MSPQEELARLFHESYERLAPTFYYKTRLASAVPWEQVPEQNRQLMIAVAAEILHLDHDPHPSWQQAAIRNLRHWCVAIDERDEARAFAENRADQIGTLRDALSRAVSALKSGEPWHENGCESCAQIAVALGMTPLSGERPA